MGYLVELDTPSPRIFLQKATKGTKVLACKRDEIQCAECGESRMGIEQATQIIPVAVARSVWSEACVFVGTELPQAWVPMLVEKAGTVYSRHRRFRRLLQQPGNAGRDWLWAFMRHWLAALIWKHQRALYARLPSSYNLGVALPKAIPIHDLYGLTEDEIKIVESAAK